MKSPFPVDGRGPRAGDIVGRLTKSSAGWDGFCKFLLRISGNIFDIPAVFQQTGQHLLGHSSDTILSIFLLYHRFAGFSTVDFNLWPQFSKSILVLLMFIGACAGSTGGGIKVSRIIVLCKTVLNELRMTMHPRRVGIVRFEGHTMEKSVVHSIERFFAAYILIFVASMLIISLDNLDFTSSFTAVAATLNNIGPGLEAVGPSSNFGNLSMFTKYILMFDMLAGRLEIFPMLVLLMPTTWKK